MREYAERLTSRESKRRGNNTNRSVDVNDTRTISTNWWAGRERIYPTEFVSPSRPMCHASLRRFHVYPITLRPYIRTCNTYVRTPWLYNSISFPVSFPPLVDPIPFHTLYLVSVLTVEEVEQCLFQSELRG